MEKLDACVACNKFFIADARGIAYVLAERRDSLEAIGLVQGHRRLLTVAGFETHDFVPHMSRLTLQGLEYLLSQTGAAEVLESVHAANLHGTLINRAQGAASDWSFALIGDEVRSAARGGRIAGPGRAFLMQLGV